MYAPSKGFRKYPARFKTPRWLGATLLPTELGYPVNMLANPQGVAAPDDYETIVCKWKDGTPITEVNILCTRRFWNGFVRLLRAAHFTKNKVSETSALAKLGRKTIHVPTTTYRIVTGEKTVIHSVETRKHTLKVTDLNVVSLENSLSRKAQKAEKHKIHIRVSILAKRLKVKNPKLTAEQAMMLAEEDYKKRFRAVEEKGKPSYQYAVPRFDAHNLEYLIQDNSKTTTIVNLSGPEARAYVASLKDS